MTHGDELAVGGEVKTEHVIAMHDGGVSDVFMVVARHEEIAVVATTGTPFTQEWGLALAGHAADAMTTAGYQEDADEMTEKVASSPPGLEFLVVMTYVTVTW